MSNPLTPLEAELLAAIGPLLAAHERFYGVCDPSRSSAGEEQQRARAAIARAEGKAQS